MCRACTSHINGQAAQICTVTISQVAGKNVVTIEGLAKTAGCTPYSWPGWTKTSRNARTTIVALNALRLDVRVSQGAGG